MSHSAARSGHVEREGLSLRYVEWGPASAPPVVMLHGLRSYAHTWEPVAQALLPHWRVIALDQRGRGGSDWDAQRRYHTASYVADLEALVDALGLARFVLVGHSMGGTNAIVYAARHPERVSGLVIEDMGPGASMASGGTDRIKRELKATPASLPTGPRPGPSGVASGRTSRKRRCSLACCTRSRRGRVAASCGAMTPKASPKRG
jgi:pimeloyl-ACP methyl ester carboxylesterase